MTKNRSTTTDPIDTRPTLCRKLRLLLAQATASSLLLKTRCFYKRPFFDSADTKLVSLVRGSSPKLLDCLSLAWMNWIPPSTAAGYTLDLKHVLVASYKRTLTQSDINVVVDIMIVRYAQVVYNQNVSSGFHSLYLPILNYYARNRKSDHNKFNIITLQLSLSRDFEAFAQLW